MPKNGPPYRIDLRARIVALVREGRSAEELSAEFGPSPATIRRWVELAGRSGGPRDRSPSSDRERSGPEEPRRPDRARDWHRW